MNRKTFLGVLGSGIGALLNLPKKANAVVSAVAPKPLTASRIFALLPDPPRHPIDDWFDKPRPNIVDERGFPTDSIQFMDHDGRIYRHINGEWVHIGTAMKEAGPRRA